MQIRHQVVALAASAAVASAVAVSAATVPAAQTAQRHASITAVVSLVDINPPVMTVGGNRCPHKFEGLYSGPTQCGGKT